MKHHHKNCQHDDHHDSHEHCGHHHGHGSHERHGKHGHHEEHRGGKRLKRLFERGDLQLLLLLQLKTKNSHGYELIKSINDLTSGLYEPSPGVLYPTLSMLEDQELIVQDANETNRKVYMITPLGLDHLQQHEAKITLIKERLASTQHAQDNVHISNELEDAIRRFKMLMRHQIRQDQISQDQLNKIVAIINQANLEIEKAYQAIAPNHK